jgi:anhydro-N-acetylmuramic acid kinase
LNTALLTKLNAFDYYQQPFPKSLANDYGTDIVFPLIQSAGLAVPDALRTYTEHIVLQLGYSIAGLHTGNQPAQLLATGGGAHNHFLIQRIQAALSPLQIEVVVPDAKLINYKEALVMGLLAVLRWREENTVLHTVTGATRSSIGGAVWMGQEA